MRLRLAAVMIGLGAFGTSMLALQPREEYVGLGVSFLTVGQAYRATTEGGKVFYEGEPVRALVVLVNQMPQLVKLDERRGPWADAVWVPEILADEFRKFWPGRRPDLTLHSSPRQG